MSRNVFDTSHINRCIWYEFIIISSSLILFVLLMTLSSDYIILLMVYISHKSIVICCANLLSDHIKLKCPFSNLCMSVRDLVVVKIVGWVWNLFCMGRQQIMVIFVVLWNWIFFVTCLLRLCCRCHGIHFLLMLFRTLL